MSKRNIKLLGFSLIGILILIVVVAAGLPLLNQTTAQSAEITQEEDNLTTLQQQLATLQGVQEKYPAVDQINQELAAKFPNIQQGSDLLDNISIAAIGAGMSPSQVTNITIAPPAVVTPPVVATPTETPAEGGDAVDAAEDAAADAAPEATDGATPPAAGEEAGSGSSIAAMAVTLSVEGTPEQLQEFLTQMSNMTRVVKIQGVSFASTEDGKSTLAITGESYLYAVIPSPEVPPATEEGTTETPAE